MAEVAVRLACVKHISAWEAGLGSDVAPGTFPLRAREAEMGSLASLAPQTGHVGNALPPGCGEQLPQKQTGALV